jgi:hypothetical protein
MTAGELRERALKEGRNVTELYPYEDMEIYIDKRKALFSSMLLAACFGDLFLKSLRNKSIDYPNELGPLEYTYEGELSGPRQSYISQEYTPQSELKSSIETAEQQKLQKDREYLQALNADRGKIEDDSEGEKSEVTQTINPQAMKLLQTGNIKVIPQSQNKAVKF